MDYSERVKTLMIEIAEKYGYDLEDYEDLISVWSAMLSENPWLSGMVSFDDIIILRDEMSAEAQEQ